MAENQTRFRRIFISSLLNQVLIFGLQFFSSVFIVRSLEIDHYALYILFNTTLSLATNLSNMGLRTYLTRFVPGSEPEKGLRILWSVLGVQVLASFAVLAVGVPAFLWKQHSVLEKFPSEPASLLIALFAILLFTSYAPRQFSGYFRYQSESHTLANRIQFISGVSYPVLILISILAFKTLSLGYALGCMVVSQVINNAYVAYLAKKSLGPVGSSHLVDGMKAAFAYSWPFALLPVATQLIEVGNRYFLAGYRTPVELAAFSFNYGICSAASNLLTTSMSYTFFPMAMALYNKGEREEGKALNLKGVLICSLLIAVFFVSYNFLSHPFLRILGRSQFTLGTLPLLLISLSFLFQSLAQHPGFLMQVYNIRLSNVGITLSGTALSLLLNFLFIGQYAVTGAALALCLTSAYLLAMNALSVMRRRPHPAPAEAS